MNCPQCSHPVTEVTNSRPFGGESIRRRRSCPACKGRFTTFELALPESIVSQADVTVGGRGHSIGPAIDLVNLIGAMDFKDREIIMEVVRRFGGAS